MTADTPHHLLRAQVCPSVMSRSQNAEKHTEDKFKVVFSKY